jgi:peroxiredoxin Q/BCP
MSQALKKLPHFVLFDQDGKERTDTEFLGKWLVFYFYPKDNTPGCTKQACSLRDAWSRFAAENISVIGISKDSVTSHKKFQEKHNLPFILLSDPDAKVIEAFGAWGKKKFMGKEYFGILRNTYIFTPSGELYAALEKVTPAGHADRILQTIAGALQ